MRGRKERTGADIGLRADNDRGCWHLAGKLTFDNADAACDHLESLIELENANRVDLGAIEAFDSAGLAILIELHRAARAKGGSIHYQNVPIKLDKLITTTEVDGVLSIDYSA